MIGKYLREGAFHKKPKADDSSHFTAEAQRTPRFRREKKRRGENRMEPLFLSLPLSAKPRRSLRLCGEMSRYPAHETRPRKLLLFLICLVALCGFGCRAEKAQDIRPAERVELLALDENDPRPYFHAELKFANPDQVKLPGRAEDL